MDIVFVGAGRLATNMAQALSQRGHCIKAVYSRTLANAEALACSVGAMATDDVAQLPDVADAFIIAVRDAAIAEVLPALTAGRRRQVMLHTSGSVAMAVLGERGAENYGVVYPMQTFSKERLVDFARVPIFIEGNGNRALDTARRIATALSSCVEECDSAARRQLHLAAVFACNFANHCYALAAEVLERAGIGFDAMLPLIDETTAKVHCLHPRDAQTGPAVRYDEGVIRAHLEMLAAMPDAQRVYSCMSESIHNHQTTSR